MFFRGISMNKEQEKQFKWNYLRQVLALLDNNEELFYLKFMDVLVKIWKALRMLKLYLICSCL
jgi:hypothetical protein